MSGMAVVGGTGMHTKGDCANGTSHCKMHHSNVSKII